MTEKTKKRTTSDSSQNEGQKKIKSSNSCSSVLSEQDTSAKLDELCETENLYHSDFFRIQVERVLQEVKVKEKYTKLFETWFSQLKASLLEDDDTEVMTNAFNISMKYYHSYIFVWNRMKAMTKAMRNLTQLKS